jgi:hypothetical protein
VQRDCQWDWKNSLNSLKTDAAGFIKASVSINGLKIVFHADDDPAVLKGFKKTLHGDRRTPARGSSWSMGGEKTGSTSFRIENDMTLLNYRHRPTGGD